MEAIRLKHHVYHITSEHVWSTEQWCAILKGGFSLFSYEVNEKKESNMRFFDPRDPGPMSISRLTKENIYQPAFGLEEAFSDYMKWVQNTGLFWI